MNIVSTNKNICPRCGIITDEKANRMVTDSCGHQKCRRCLLADEDCMECLIQQEQQQQYQEENIYIELVALRNGIPQATQSDCQLQVIPTTKPSKENGIYRRKGRKVATMPPHIRRVQADSESNSNSASHYYCTRCCRKFTSRSQQYYHIKCGDEEKKHKCQHCNKAFTSSSHLKYHLEAHKGNTYNCNYCNKTFTNRIVLRKHEKQHYTETLKCSDCSKEFRSKFSLSAHIRKFHDERELPHKCPECQKSYALKSALKQHMQKHFEKKYACKYCDKLFQRNYTLKLHQKKHTNTEYFICGICCREFSDAAVLLRHSKIHEETAIKYRCIECDVTIMRKDNMLRHVRAMHPEESFENCVEISQPTNTAAAHHEIETQTHTSAANDESTTEPKTVENSAVIRCVGNVEPMKIPTEISAEIPSYETYAMLKQVDSLDGDDTTLTTTLSAAAALAPLQNASVNITNNNNNNNHNNIINGKLTVVRKKVKKKYDPIKMYRKILASDCEFESLDESESETEKTSGVPPTTVQSVYQNEPDLYPAEDCTTRSFWAVPLPVQQQQQQLEEANSREKLVNVTLIGDVHASPLQKSVTLTSTSNFSEKHWRKNFKYTYECKDF